MITETYLLERLDRIREAQIEQGAHLRNICLKLDRLAQARITADSSRTRTSIDKLLTGESLRWVASGLILGLLLKTGDITAVAHLIGKLLGSS